ncbi:hypothetical protein GCM10009552_06460 [Rothia nasimurium]
MCQRGLADAGYVFQQQVATGQQACKGEFHLSGFAQQYAIDLRKRGIETMPEHFIVERSRS